MNKTYPFQNLSSSPTAKPEGSLDIPVTITSDGLHLSGDLVVPTEATGLVLFAQGGGGGRFSPRNLAIAEKLQMDGFGTLLFDLLTREEEAADAVHLHLRGNIPLLARRLAGATRWARSQPETRNLVMGYAGSATGAAAALVAAAELGSMIRAIVSLSGQPELAPVSLAEVRAATLFIVGEHEKVVQHHNAVALEQLFCEKQLVVVSHATHSFAERGAMEAVSRLTLDWFQRHLRP